MQYYTFEFLDNLSKDLYVVATPLGKFKFNCLLMGIKQDVLEGIDECDNYIYDTLLGAFNNSWENHLKTLERILTCLYKPIILLLIH